MAHRVSSAIVQRYLDHVLEAALSQNAQIQAIAIDVLSFTIKQGLAHPLQVCLCPLSARYLYLTPSIIVLPRYCRS